MSTELTQEKLKKIAVAHRINPYADIIPYELGFGFPQIYYSGFFTQPDEFILVGLYLRLFRCLDILLEEYACF